MKKRFIVPLFILMFAISTVFVSANIFDWFGKITGNATTASTDASVTISNSAPVIYMVVSNDSSAPPILNQNASDNRIFSFTFNITDLDGLDDFDNNSINLNLSLSGETTVVNTSCIKVDPPVNATTINFTCDIGLNYFGSPGTWSVSINSSDQSASNGLNNSVTVTVESLNAMTTNVTSLTWAALSVTSTNQGSNNDPMAIFNKGNADLHTSVTAKNLLGYTDGTKMIEAALFEVDDATEGCSGTALVNATSTNITAVSPALLNGYGNFGDRYFCITAVNSSATAQPYAANGSATTYGTWTITSVTA